ncbi:MAG: Asp-tRNA(Asn)/Glu-tRNA(Gln) amidotransferase subunit GatC [Legionella sp.]|nr:Asp-tRNA(Asn)/Glu-tRNA(Gln) amidotransferase subunit GatC [Legionella sp.]
MSISPEALEKIARLAYLDTEHSTRLPKEINAIMDFVEQLRSVDTTGVAPLFHPLELHQRLRPDVVTQADCLQQLKDIAPHFEDNHYLVPTVLELDN